MGFLTKITKIIFCLNDVINIHVILAEIVPVISLPDHMNLNDPGPNLRHLDRICKRGFPENSYPSCFPGSAPYTLLLCGVVLPEGFDQRYHHEQ